MVLAFAFCVHCACSSRSLRDVLLTVKMPICAVSGKPDLTPRSGFDLSFVVHIVTINGAKYLELEELL